MKAILLCAGYATRLYPLTKDQPKPLLPLGGKPILDYVLEKLETISSVNEVFVVTNDRFYEHFKKWAQTKGYPWKTEVVNDGTATNETRLGAIGDMRLVVQKFKIREDLAVFAGDNIFRSNLKSFIAFAESHRPNSSVGVIDVKNIELAKQYGIVETDKNSKIVQFLEKPSQPPSTLASTGVYWFAKESLNLLDRYVNEGHNADRPGDYIRWLVSVDQVFAYPFEGHWFDIGDMNSYREADSTIGKEVSSKEKIKKLKGF